MGFSVKLILKLKQGWEFPSRAHLLSSRAKRTRISIGARATFGTFGPILTPRARGANLPLVITTEVLIRQAGPVFAARDIPGEKAGLQQEAQRRFNCGV